MAPVVPVAPCNEPAARIDADFIRHADDLIKGLRAERSLRDQLDPACREAESMAKLALHKRHIGDQAGAEEDLRRALLHVHKLLHRPNSDQHQDGTALSQAMIAVATAQIFEAFLVTGSLGARPAPSPEWSPEHAPQSKAPASSAAAATTPHRQASSSAAPTASPYRYNGLLLYLSDSSNTGYAGVSRVASAPDPRRPYLAGYQSGVSPAVTMLGWHSTAVEGAMAYSRHVKTLSEIDEGAEGAEGETGAKDTVDSEGAEAAAVPAPNELAGVLTGVAPGAPTPTSMVPGARTPPEPAPSSENGPTSPGVAAPVKGAPGAAGAERRACEYEDTVWLLALVAACHEICRYATGRGTHGDVDSVRAARAVVSALWEEFLAFDGSPGPLRGAYSELKDVVHRLDDTQYQLSLHAPMASPAADGGGAGTPAACIGGGGGGGEADTMHTPRARRSSAAAVGRVGSGALFDADAVRAARERYDASAAAREAVVKRCADLQRLAKAAVFALHRGDQPRAEVQLAQACEGARAMLAAAASKHSEHRRLWEMREMLQTAVAASMFAAWLACPGRLLHLHPEAFGGLLPSSDEYVTALSDLAGEIGRYAVARATTHDADGVRTCLGTVLSLQTVAMRLGSLWPRGDRHKLDALAAVPRTLELLLYDHSLSLRAGGLRDGLRGVSRAAGIGEVSD